MTDGVRQEAARGLNRLTELDPQGVIQTLTFAAIIGAFLYFQDRSEERAARVDAEQAVRINEIFSKGQERNMERYNNLLSVHDRSIMECMRIVNEAPKPVKEAP